MSSLIYKCPHCGSGLLFRPETQRFACEYCASDFSEAELAAKQPVAKDSREIPEEASETTTPDTGKMHALQYQCPSCGGEIIGDESTAATACVYCHNPVILSGRLSGEWQPDAVIPFAFDKKVVTERVRAWAEGRWFMKSDFLGAASIENLRGVYFPFWLVEGGAYGQMRIAASNSRVWRVGDKEYTETSRYDVIREGDLAFTNLFLKATTKESARMIDGIYPYDSSGVREFSMPYLSGFLAEKRNTEKADAEPEARDMLNQGSREALLGSVSGYDSVYEQGFSLSKLKESWRYALMPVWLLTYKYGGENYFFAMNGQTGKVAGRVPVSRAKLAGFFALVSAVVTAVAALALRRL